MEDLHEVQYNRAIDPNKLFSTIKEVEDFMDIEHTPEDLRCFLKYCEENECYEFCAVIFERLKKEIKTKELNDKIDCFFKQSLNKYERKSERKIRKTVKS